MSYLRVTLNDIATRLGLDRSTVSRALRGSVRVKPETRERVRALAKELGYRPDPGLASLVSMRKKIRSTAESTGYTIALVTNDRVDSHREDEFFSFCKEEADRLGYGLEEFPCHHYSRPGQLERILISRGTSGILVARNLYTAKPPLLPCHRIPTVWLDSSIPSCPSPVVMTNAFHAVEVAWSRLLEAGHRKIGFLHDRFYIGEDHMRDGAYRHFRALEGKQKHPPILHLGVKESRETALPVIREWVLQTQVTAVIAHFGHWYYWFRDAGLQIPEDLVFVGLMGGGRDSRICGFEDPWETTARVAIRQLDQMVRSQDPESCTTNHWILVCPKWIPGESFPESSREFYCISPDTPQQIWRNQTPWPLPRAEETWNQMGPESIQLPAAPTPTPAQPQAH